MLARAAGDLIREAAREFEGGATPGLDARVLAKWAFGYSDLDLIARSSDEPSEDARAQFFEAVRRRKSGEPVAYIVGEKEFWGLTFKMRRGVLVPRPDTETLIAAAIARRPRDRAMRILDLGCGSGALLGALLVEFPAATGVGVDANADAAALSCDNLRALGLAGRSEIIHADWSAIEGAFDIIASNPPYVPEGDREQLSKDVREFEDPCALFAGADGLAAYRALSALLPRLAAPGALCVIEFGMGQAEAVRGLFSGSFDAAKFTIGKDLAGRDRALIIDLALGAN